MLTPMRVISSPFFAAVVVIASFASGNAAAQDPCTVGDPDTCDADGQIIFCNAGTTEAFDCNQLAAGASCAPLACGGPGCPADLINACVGTDRGDSCLGVATFFDGDDSNDDTTFMAVNCASGSACVASASGETCAALPSGVSACTSSSISCVGDAIVACQGYTAATNSVSSPGVFPCSVFGAGFTCQENDAGEVIGCGNPACGDEGAGRCDGNTRVDCTEGVENERENCATFGSVCVQDQPDQSPSCVTADEECGPTGGGECNGNVASICSGGVFQTTTDCSTNGLVCGTVAGTTRIGCVERGGEGEGEAPADECSRDSDCDDDEECDGGECVSADGGNPRRNADPEPVPAPGFFSCAAAGAFPAGSVVVAGLALALRRRRRS